MTTYMIYFEGSKEPLHHSMETLNASPEGVIESLSEFPEWNKPVLIENLLTGIVWANRNETWIRIKEPRQPMPEEVGLFDVGS